MSFPAQQMNPIQLERSHGIGRMAVSLTDGRTRTRHLYQKGCAKIRVPNAHGAKELEAVMINTAGGLTDGDKLEWDFETGDHTELTTTTQANEKIYRSSGGTALVRSSCSVGEGSFLAWLPQETILYDRSNLSRDLRFVLAKSASLLACEVVVFGRKGFDERLSNGAFKDRWRIWRGGKLVHAEDINLSGQIGSQLSCGAIADGAGAVATIILIRPDARDLVQEARILIASREGLSGAVSFVSNRDTGKLVLRLLAEDSYALRKALVPLLSLLKGSPDLPKMWAS